MKTLIKWSTFCTAACFLSCNLEKVNDFGLPDNVKFKTEIGGSWTDYPMDVLVTSQGQYLIVGCTYDNQSSFYQQAYIGLVNGTGDIIGQKDLGGTGNEIAIAAVESSSGDFVVCGHSSPPFSNAQLLIAKVKKDMSSTIWEKSFSNIDSFYYSIGIVPVTSGGYLILYTANGPNSNMNDIKLLKIDENGNKVFDKLLVSTFGNYVDLIKTKDNGIVAVGNETGYSIVAKWDEQGVFKWQGRYPISNANGANSSSSVLETTEGNYIAGGSNSYFDEYFNQNQLLLFSGVGSFIHQDSWGDTLDNQILGLRETGDDNLVVLGTEGDNIGMPYQVFLSKRSKQTGVEYWKKDLFDGFPLYGDIEKCSDGGYIICGSSYYTPNNIILVKTDKDGNYQ